MIAYITFLRALASCLITNAHYTGVYPTDIIANGGLLGDVIFFAVSGYCLCNLNQSFTKWYPKRLTRIYVPVLLITTVYLVLGAYPITEEQNVFWWLVFPTNYHFVASIILLYVPFYIMLKRGGDYLPHLMAGVAFIYILVYFFIYDKSYYHIDNVREPMIRFLFMEAMLLGAWFRKRDQYYRNNRRYICYSSVLFIGTFLLYFASKLLFSKIQRLSQLQIINQIVLLILLYFLFCLVSALDSKINTMPTLIRKSITFIADRTLEIYLVQYVLIDLIRPHFTFPINWIVLTSSILISAIVLHEISSLILKYMPFTSTTKGQ